MYCRQCGKELPDGAQFCPYCGAASNAENAGGQNAARQNGSDNGYAAPPYPPLSATPVSEPAGHIQRRVDRASGSFSLLWGCPVSSYGKRSCPTAARACGKGALIGVIVYAAVVVLTVILMVVIFAIAASAAPYY